MQLHLRPMPRVSRGRRRVAAAAAVGAIALLGAGALVLRVPSATSPGVIARGPAAAIGLEPTPSDSAAAAATLIPAAIEAPPPSPRPVAPAVTAARPPHVALDAWPRPTPAPVASLTGYDWPVAHPRISLPFGPTLWGTRLVNGELFHDGLDIATFCGDRVLATHDGVVLAAGRHFDAFLGWVGSLEAYTKRLDVHHLWAELPIVVITDDGNGYRSVYAHFSKVTVQAGQRIRAGQLIGYEGMSGHATGCHVHYGLFSPFEAATFGIRPFTVKNMRLPGLEIARVDPLLVLPYRKGVGGVVRP